MKKAHWELIRGSEYGADQFQCSNCGRKVWSEKDPEDCGCREAPPKDTPPALQPRVHELKTWPEFFQAIVTGKKRFEFRKDDRGFTVGDCVLLYYWDPSPSTSYAPLGRSRVKSWTFARIDYVLRGYSGLPEAHAVLSITPRAPLSESLVFLPEDYLPIRYGISACKKAGYAKSL